MVPPTIRLQAAVVEINGSVLVSSFLNAFDTDGDPITLYEIRDDGTDGGYFELNGFRQAPNQFFDVLPSQLNQLVYRGGNFKATETISVKVSDDTSTSNIRTTTVTTGNSRPIAGGRNFRVKPGEQLSIAGLVSITDADGDGIRQYGFVDRSSGFDSGRFLLDGVEQFQANWFFLPSRDLSKVSYQAGTVGRRTETIGVMAYDGFSYSLVGEFSATTSAKPVISAGVENEVLVGQRLAASEIFQTSDADGDAIQHYFVVDRSIGVGGGYWEFKGQRQEQSRFFRVLQSELNQLFYVGGATSPQVENLGFMAYDGFEFSDVVDLAVTTVSRPTVAPPVVLPGTAEVQTNRAVRGDELFTAFDADGDPIDRYWLADRSTAALGGYFEVNGVRQPSARFFSVSAAEFETVRYVGGRYGVQTENIGVQVLAGGRLSDVTDVTVTTLPNLNAPVPELIDIRDRIGTTFQAEDLFTYTDVEDNPILRFGFYDGETTGGFFTVNGVRQPGKQWVILDFDQLDTVEYNVGSTPGEETLAMFLNDGIPSEIVFSQASAFQSIIRVVENDISIDTLEVVEFQPLVEQFQDYTTFQVFDENLSPVNSPVQQEDRSAKLLLDGVPLAAQVIHSLTAEEFGRLQIRGAEVDLGRRIDPIVFRASTGEGNFSEWERININTDPVGSDALIGKDDHTDLTSAELQLPDLTVANVPDQTKHIVTYSFIDGGNQVRRDGKLPVGDPPTPTYYEANSDYREDPLALNQAQRESIRSTIDNFEVYTNIDFVEVPYELTASQAQITFGTADLGIPGPGSIGIEAPVIGSGNDGRGTENSDIWYNNLFFSPIVEFDDDGIPIEAASVELGEAFYYNTLVQVGRSLGLKTPIQGSPALSVFNNHRSNTVMAESMGGNNQQNPEGADHPLLPSTLQLYDIVRLQEVYGANPVFNPSDNVYSFDVDLQQTLYDTGGFDTLDFSGSAVAEIIDLREGQWSTILGNPNGEDTDLSLRIAYGVTIENAFGGASDDSVQGNEVSNILRGNEGADVLIGAGDNDQLYGGSGDDRYIWRFGDGRDSIREEGEGGFDVLEIRDSSGTLGALEQGLVFRRLGNDLRIDLRVEGQSAQGTVLIKDYADAGSEVETLSLFAADGSKIGSDVDLTTIFSNSDETFKRFVVTTDQNANGSIAIPV